jgi:transcriptional regulator with XRE-family HTH domain
LNRLKALRAEKNIKQDVLAKLLGLEIAGISKLETGRVPLKDEYIIKLSDFFNVSTDYLLGKTDIRQPITQINFEKHLLNSKFAEKYNKLTDEQKKTLDSLVEVWEKENKKEKE